MPTLRNNGPLLMPSSAHDPHVHRSWPIAYCRRLYFRSSTLAAFYKAKAEFCQRLQASYICPSIISDIHNENMYVIPHHNTFRIPRTNWKPQNVFFCMLPRHPVYTDAGLGKIAREFFHRRDNQDLLKMIFGDHVHRSVMLSWKLTSLPFSNTLVVW